ncbi:Rho GTPase activating protein 39 [Balamuthia mandrillaris]
MNKSGRFRLKNKSSASNSSKAIKTQKASGSTSGGSDGSSSPSSPQRQVKLKDSPSSSPDLSSSSPHSSPSSPISLANHKSAAGLKRLTKTLSSRMVRPKGLDSLSSSASPPSPSSPLKSRLNASSTTSSAASSSSSSPRELTEEERMEREERQRKEREMLAERQKELEALRTEQALKEGVVEEIRRRKQAQGGETEVEKELRRQKVEELRRRMEMNSPTGQRRRRATSSATPSCANDKEGDGIISPDFPSPSSSPETARKWAEHLGATEEEESKSSGMRRLSRRMSVVVRSSSKSLAKASSSLFSSSTSPPMPRKGEEEQENVPVQKETCETEDAEAEGTEEAKTQDAEEAAFIKELRQQLKSQNLGFSVEGEDEEEEPKPKTPRQEALAKSGQSFYVAPTKNSNDEDDDVTSSEELLEDVSPRSRQKDKSSALTRSGNFLKRLPRNGSQILSRSEPPISPKRSATTTSYSAPDITLSSSVEVGELSKYMAAQGEEMALTARPTKKDKRDWRRSMQVLNKGVGHHFSSMLQYGDGIVSRNKKKKKGKKETQAAPTPLFGTTLQAIMDAQKETHPSLRVPFLLVRLTQAIYQLNGFETEGLFRVPGNATGITELKQALNERNYDSIMGHNVHTVGGALKLWFRELEQPLIPVEFYDACTKEGVESGEKAMSVLERLPLTHKQVISFLLRFLIAMSQEEHVAKTKMTMDNLALVFAPGFLRCPDPQKMLFMSSAEQDFLLNLLQGYAASRQYAEDVERDEKDGVGVRCTTTLKGEGEEGGDEGDRGEAEREGGIELGGAESGEVTL